MQSRTGYNSKIFISDGCNSFVFYGGIIDLVFLGAILAFVVLMLHKKYRELKRYAASHHELKSNPFLAPVHSVEQPCTVVVAESHQAIAPAVPNSQGLPIVDIIA